MDGCGSEGKKGYIKPMCLQVLFCFVVFVFFSFFSFLYIYIIYISFFVRFVFILFVIPHDIDLRVTIDGFFHESSP